MNPLEALLMLLLTSGGTMDPKGRYKAYHAPDGSIQTVNSRGISDDRYEYVVPTVKNGQPLDDPYGEMLQSGEYLAKFPRGPIGRALGGYTGGLVHKWQEENNMPRER